MAAGPQELEKCPFLHNFVWHKNYLTDGTYAHLVAIISVIKIAVLAIILTNAAVIYTVGAKRRLRSNSNVLVGCLAGQDLITGLVVQPLNIAIDIERIHGDGSFCTLEKVCTIGLVGVGFLSLFHIVLVCIDRYIATKHPMRYQDNVTIQRLIIGVLSGWGVTFFISIAGIVFAVIDSESEPYSLSMNTLDKLLAMIAMVCTVFIVYSYRYIYSEARRQKRRLQTEQLPHEEAKRLEKDNKAANTLAIIMGTLVLTYLPAIITSIVTIYIKDITAALINILWSWCLTFVALGSLCNPIVYFWRIKKFRHAFLEIVHLKQPHSSSPEMEMQAITRHRWQVAPAPPAPLSEATAVTNQQPVWLPSSSVGTIEPSTCC